MVEFKQTKRYQSTTHRSGSFPEQFRQSTRTFRWKLITGIIQGFGTWTFFKSVSVSACMHVCMYVCMHVCVYQYVLNCSCIYRCIYIHHVAYALCWLNDGTQTCTVVYILRKCQQVKDLSAHISVSFCLSVCLSVCLCLFVKSYRLYCILNHWLYMLYDGTSLHHVSA